MDVHDGVPVASKHAVMLGVGFQQRVVARATGFSLPIYYQEYTD